MAFETITEDHDGNIWCGSLGGVNRFDGKKWTNYDSDNGIPGELLYIRHIAVDSDNTIWVGTFTGGVAKFQDNQWMTMDTADGLADMEVHFIHLDSDGSKWFCTGKIHGISILKPDKTWEYLDGSY